MVGPPLWNISKSVGMIRNTISGKTKNVSNHQVVVWDTPRCPFFLPSKRSLLEPWGAVQASLSDEQCFPSDSSVILWWFYCELTGKSFSMLVFLGNKIWTCRKIRELYHGEAMDIWLYFEHVWTYMSVIHSQDVLGSFLGSSRRFPKEPFRLLKVHGVNPI